ncbi:pentatricopeptide repeat-containing protein At1g62350-like [Aristolochia californica]|uniref:pentatricopeptide repeat-containing protein At1g62350-like n=1 Tax=Aristolochia californica TaxID=171875 RepID=UPI0035E1BB41
MAVASLWYSSSLHLASASFPVSKIAGHHRVKCSLRDKGLKKKPLWRKAQDMSTEAIQASRALKLAFSDHQNVEQKIAAVFLSKISRLLKADLLSLLSHLQRSNFCTLAVKVFEHARKETWYKPDIVLFYDMIYMLARNELVEEAEFYFIQLQLEGLQPDWRVFTEMIGAYMEVGMVDKSMEMYTSMKELGCKPSELTYKILINNLVRFGRDDLVELVKKEVDENLDEPDLIWRSFDKRTKAK